LNIELPPAPIREEIFDLLFDACLKNLPNSGFAIIEVTEDGHGFSTSGKRQLSIESTKPLCARAFD
jgi:hypothetical protein